MRQVRPSRGWWGIVALAGLWACETARNPSGTQFDLIPPAITLTASADTQQIASGLQFTVSASDNLSLKDIQLTYSGGYIAQTDTVFTQATTTFNQSPNITFPANSGAGGLIKIVGRASDGAGNFATDSITIFLSNVQALKLFEVCRLRDIPIVTFINKMDREAQDPFALLDEIASKLALDPAPLYRSEERRAGKEG